MERKDRSTIVSIRVPDGLLEKIEKDIETSGDFTSRADYILSALRFYEEHRTKVLAERKIAYQEEDYVPTSSRSLPARDDEVKG
ncbi:hypothetical protein [Candidatus Methanoprimaticola sp. MG2]|uniref:hypothetical protein n=1 Tax=Candidatus Methanoprimaticola sp. MG2 TaxID=3228838 RepID=UPI0039C644DE